MAKKKIITTTKSKFLENVRLVYGKCSTNFLISMRDAFNHLILSRLKEGNHYDELIEKSKGYITYEIDY